MKDEVLIEKHLLNALSIKEQEHFDQLLDTNPNFKKELVFQKNIKQVINIEEDAQFKKQLIALENKKTAKKDNYKKWMIAASIAVLFGLGYVQLNRQPSHEALFAQNFTPFTNVIQPIVRGENTENILTKAFIAYENKDYSTAEYYFIKIGNTEDKSYTFFYAAMSQLAQDKTTEAKTQLTTYLNDSNNSLATQAHWYLALIYLKENNLKNAKTELQFVIDIKGDFETKATELLEQLD